MERRQPETRCPRRVPKGRVDDARLTLALVVDGGDVTGITRDGGRVGQFDVRGTPDQSLDLQLGYEFTRTTRVKGQSDV